MLSLVAVACSASRHGVNGKESGSSVLEMSFFRYDGMLADDRCTG